VSKPSLTHRDEMRTNLRRSRTAALHAMFARSSAGGLSGCARGLYCAKVFTLIAAMRVCNSANRASASLPRF